MGVFSRLVEALEAEGRAALVTLVRVDGSGPQAPGAGLVLRATGGFRGTIGGGALEWEALAAAKAALARGRGPDETRITALGPELGQCCGGRVEWRIETFDVRDLEALRPLVSAERKGPFTLSAEISGDGRTRRSLVAVDPNARGRVERHGEALSRLQLHGAGHVGRALVLALAPLPFTVDWIDSRPEAFPERTPANVRMIAAVDPPSELRNAPDGAMILVMTHSHPLDLAIVAAALTQPRFAFVGLIGSQSKRARFLSRLREGGLSDAALHNLVCPIGLPQIVGKDPPVIAASVAAQLLAARASLQRRDARGSGAAAVSEALNLS